MDTFKFIEGDVAPGFKANFEPSLFNLENHRLLQSAEGWLSFHLVEPARKRVAASAFFCVQRGIVLSPLRAPFGGIECSGKLPTQALFGFIGDIELALRGKGIKSINLKLAPSLYHPALHNTLAVLLLNHGYQILHAELGACLPVLNEPPLLTRFDPWEKRRLKQAVKVKLEFRALPLKSLHTIYHFILHCREQRGHSLSMDYGSLLETANQFKNNFFLFGIYKEQELIAASIAIQVNSKVLYNFYSAHAKKHNDLSPVVFLIHEMHNWCFERKINLLDLGTSALEGKPNFPLIDFKLRLGAKPAMKPTFEKKLR